MTTVATGRKTRLFANTTTLTSGAVFERHADWNAGRTVSSGLVAVGNLSLSEEEVLFLGGRRLLGDSYSLLSEGSAPWQRLGVLRSAFLSLVMEDAGHTDLASGRSMTTRVFAGQYSAEHDAEPWHADDHPDVSVRYAVAYGVGSTLSAVGLVSRSDIVADGPNRGDLLPNVPLGPEGQLDPVDHPTGTILRWTAPDIHAGPAGEGTRVLLQTTIYL